jgi:N-acetylmuramic acid 6-phosphate etherase
MKIESQMAQSLTETLLPAADGLDALPDAEILSRLHRAQVDAVDVVRQALPEIGEASQLMSHAVQTGGSLIYAGAGSSALMASADAIELHGTFGISTERIRILMAGGLPRNANMPGDTEDNVGEASRAAEIIAKGDVVIIVSASGRTPYAMTVAKAAKTCGAETICIANNQSAPLFEYASVAVCLPITGELIAGSTRMGAGSAQKVALNMMSTLMGVHLGHIHDGMMVNLHADNEKLQARAVGMVSHIAGIAEDSALAYLSRAGGSVKQAVLLAAGVESLEKTNTLLEQSKQHLRVALDLVNAGKFAG